MKLDLNNPAHRDPAILKMRGVDATVLQYFPNPKDEMYPHSFVIETDDGNTINSYLHNGRYTSDLKITEDDLIFKPFAVVPFGHNTKSITFAQLGEEYRLLNWDEIKDRDKELEEIEIWQSGEWYSEVYGSDISETYRTKLTREELAALTEQQSEEEQQPTEKPFWSKPEDVPMGAIWIRRKYNIKRRELVLLVGDSFIETDNDGVYYERISEYEYYDGTTWKECRCE